LSAVGTLHLTFSLLALLMGAIVLRLPKGTRWHRTWGHGYAWSMVGVVATSFAMYNLTGSVTPFHFAAVIAGVTLGAGMWPVLRRRPRRSWMAAHAKWMSWSYLGLMGAFGAESLTRFAMPAMEGTLTRNQLWPAFWGLVAVGSGATFVVGIRIMAKGLPVALSHAPAAMRREREEVATSPSGNG
jgi:uncharacterized membrane protein